MDTTKTITHLSLCAGYGGIDLGLRAVVPGLRTIAMVEREAFAVGNLVEKMESGRLDPCPVWTDVKTFRGEWCRGVDIISGGYPCQPFSAAGRRKGKKDPRHLWPYIRQIVAAARPALCFFENVEGHLSLGFREVHASLRRLGYAVEAGIFSAAEGGMPHQRKRLFILAHDRSRRCQDWLSAPPRWSERDAGKPGDCGTKPAGPGQPQHWWEPPRVVRNTRGNGRRQDQPGRQEEGGAAFDGTSKAVGNTRGKKPDWIPQPERREQDIEAGESGAVGDPESQRPATQRPKHEGQQGGSAPAGASAKLADSESSERGRAGNTGDAGRGASETGGSNGADGPVGKAQPPLGGNPDGPANRVDYAELCQSSDSRIDELRLLGNGVVPATAAKAFVTLMEELRL